MCALVLLAVASAVPWAFGYLLPQRGGRTLLLAGLSGWTPYGLFAVLVVTWVLRRWLVLAGVIAMLLAVVATIGPLYVADRAPAPGGPVLRVMTANLYFGTADVEDVMQLVHDRSIDVLALQELTPDAVAGLQRAGLNDELPYAVIRAAPSAQGTGLWSRRPITEVPAARMRFNACAGDITVAGHTVRLRAVHPVTPVPTTVGWRADFASMRTKAREDAGVPTILLGDFNASVHHRQLRRLLADRWRDAAEAAGAGMVRTWTFRIGAPSALDLDHVLIDRGMTADQYSTARIRGSDHRAVVVTVGVSGPT